MVPTVHFRKSTYEVSALQGSPRQVVASSGKTRIFPLNFYTWLCESLLSDSTKISSICLYFLEVESGLDLLSIVLAVSQ